VVLFVNAFDDTRRHAVEGYLSRKYGIPLSGQ